MGQGTKCAEGQLSVLSSYEHTKGGCLPIDGERWWYPGNKADLVVFYTRDCEGEPGDHAYDFEAKEDGYNDSDDVVAVVKRISWFFKLKNGLGK